MLVGPSSLLFAAATWLLAPGADAQAVAEPPNNQIYFGVWAQTDHGDGPTSYNARLGYNASMFQIAIDIPQSPYNYTTGAGGPPPEYTIEQTQTDAMVYVTVYPKSFNILQADYATLALQLKNYTEVYNRTVFLRFAPEMQGTWMVYGNQPTAFQAMWKTMYQYIKQIAPNTIIVWAPNTGQGYPYGQNLTGIAVGVNPNAAQDEQALDTNHDGQLTYLDDPFLPYYPGDDFVDWIGLSVYYKGQNNMNAPNQGDFCAQAWASTDTQSNFFGPTNFYTTYCANKPTKACMFAESGGAYHVNDTANSNVLAMQTAWINACITNTSFWDAHPRIKAYMHFEFEKLEMDGGIPDTRDYRLTNDTSVLSTFQSALATFAPNRVQWAAYRPAPSSIPTSGRPAYLPGASQNVTSQAPGIVFQTARIQDFSNPTLFGVVSAAERLQVAILSSVTVSAIVFGAASLFNRVGVP